MTSEEIAADIIELCAKLPAWEAPPPFINWHALATGARCETSWRRKFKRAHPEAYAAHARHRAGLADALVALSKTTTLREMTDLTGLSHSTALKYRHLAGVVKTPRSWIPAARWEFWEGARTKLGLRAWFSPQVIAGAMGVNRTQVVRFVEDRVAMPVWVEVQRYDRGSHVGYRVGFRHGRKD